jgi:alkylhydroperoxidase/carboxymuconolactone decarboxylase family protein YurZ
MSQVCRGGRFRPPGAVLGAAPESGASHLNSSALPDGSAAKHANVCVDDALLVRALQLLDHRQQWAFEEHGRSEPSVIDERTEALMRVAATVAVDASLSSFQHAVAVALATGATRDEIVASLEAVTPVTGAARVVQCAPKAGLALGYDVESALERIDE